MVRNLLAGLMLFSAVGIANAASLNDREFVFPEGNSMASAVQAVQESLDVLSQKAVQGQSPDEATLSKVSMVRCNLDVAMAMVNEGASLYEAKLAQPVYCHSWISQKNKARSVAALKSLGSTPAQRQVLSGVATWLNSVKY